MAKVFFKQWNMEKELSERLYLDLVSSVKGKRTKTKKLDEHFDHHIDEVRDVVEQATGKEIQALLKKHYIAALDEIRDHIKKGFAGEVKEGTLEPPGGKGWSELNKAYFRRKLRNKRKFWKHTGSTSSGYSSFAKVYRSSVKNSKNISSFLSSGRKFRGFRDRMRIDFKVPRPHQGGSFFETILHDSFFYEDSVAVNATDAAAALKGSGMVNIAYMEGFSNSARYRPFIAKTMGAAGKAFHNELDSLLRGARKQALDNVTGKALATTRFKEY